MKHKNIVCKRIDGKPVVNIPRHITHHSPDGFEWGFSGSGPADLALNILFHFTRDRDFAFAHYQRFKTNLIDGIPHEGGTIPAIVVERWIEVIKAEVSK